MKKIELSMIAAIGKNKELGKDKELLWHIPEDFQYFKNVTSGYPVIMGDVTHESIGFVLPNRLNIVLTKDKDLKGTDKLCFVNSVDEAMMKAGEAKPEKIFVIGGANVYEQFLDKVDTLYLTLIDKEFPEANVFFPDYEDVFDIVSSEGRENESCAYKFLVLKKKKDKKRNK